MPLVDSEAIILRTTPLGEADKLVSFLARGLGRLRGVARGARRPRSRFGAALEPLMHVRLWFYERAQRDLVRLAQCELVDASTAAPADYARSVALSHLAELSERLLPEREPSERPFRLLLMVVEAIRRGAEIWLPLVYFELWMVRLAGLLPALDRCNRCGRELGDEEAGFVGLGTSGTACQRCRVPGMRRLTAPTRKLAGAILANPLPRLHGLPGDRKSTGELRKYMLDLIEYHTESKLATRELLDGLE